MSRESIPRVPKLCSEDAELGNFILGIEKPGGTGYEASRAVLREIDGVPSSAPRACASRANGIREPGQPSSSHTTSDWGRKFLRTNGGCVYIDLDHLELALPEVTSAIDHLRAWHAMLRIAREACRRANERLGEGLRICLLVNNSDGLSHSYGSHLNFLTTRQAWNNIFNRRLHFLMFLAAHQASSIVYTGAGKVGAENGMPDVDFQLSQRADFLEVLTGLQTTFSRPIVNSRDESLCGQLGSAGDERLARVHCIFFDAGLCHVAHVLKVGTTQIVLAMIEAEQIGADLDLLLEDPVGAVHRWSHDITLKEKARSLAGGEVTAVEMQRRIAAEARRFVDAGGCDGMVTHASQIVDLWQDTVEQLGKLGSASNREPMLDALAPRLDWVLKYRLLQHAIAAQPGLTWQSPEIRCLDYIYGSLDPEEGLYWQAEAGGAVDRLVSDAEIDHFVQHAPEDTRAWTRAYLLSRARERSVVSVNWDDITVETEAEPGQWSRPRRVVLPLTDPLGFTRSDVENIVSAKTPLAELLERLGGYEQRMTVVNAGACSRFLH